MEIIRRTHVQAYSCIVNYQRWKVSTGRQKHATLLENLVINYKAKYRSFTSQYNNVTTFTEIGKIQWATDNRLTSVNRYVTGQVTIFFRRPLNVTMDS